MACGKGRGSAGDQQKFWSFQPVRKVIPPAVQNQTWGKNPIDAFVLARLEEKNLKPAPPADKVTLLRRATFDLTGLPPTEAEIRSFFAGRHRRRHSREWWTGCSLRRAYGERWGRHWMDVARYADSTGADEDHRYPYAWRYRDYVIDSFNRDIPYDQFVREQMAGDLLPADKPGEVNVRGMVATGFLALGPKLIAEQDKVKMFYDIVDEQIDVTVARVPRPDDRLRPLPRPQIRSHFDQGLLQPGFHLRQLETACERRKHVSELYFAPLVPKDVADRLRIPPGQNQGQAERDQ